MATVKRLSGLYMRPPKQEVPYGTLKAPPEGESCGPVGPRSTVRLCLKRIGKPGPQLQNHHQVCQFTRSMAEADRENFYALHLDARNRVIGVDHIARGTLTGVEIQPREAFKAAILNNASAVIFAHNHPSGDVAASQGDVEVTERLKRAGELTGIKVLDHVIVAPDRCASFSERGLLGRARR